MAKGPLDHLTEREKYLIALGIFIEQFARCECMLITALARLSGCDDPTSRAVFSGVRSDLARSHIRRILEARNEAMPGYLDRAFKHLTIISTLRNDLMHYGALEVGKNPAERTMVVSNDIAAMPGRERTSPISAEILTNLATDVESITAAVGLFHLTYHGVPVDLVEGWRHFAHRTWLYKPPPQGNTRQQRGGRRPTRERPPKSSRP